METNLISLIVPNYNAELYIADFIESVIRQTYTKWELLIIDDDSTDGSPAIVEKYVTSDSRVKFIKNIGNQRGADARRNQGLDMAKGEFVCFFDSDDILPYDTLEIRIKEIQTDQTIDFVITPAISFKSTPFDLRRLVLGIPIFSDDLIMFLKRYRLPFGVWTNIYRRSFLERTKLRWDESLASMQDSDFNIRALIKKPNYKYATNQRPSYYWRIGGNPSSITKSIKSQRNLESQIYFFRKLSKLFRGTEYEKALRRFGLTVLLRCAVLGYEVKAEDLNQSRYAHLRFSILRSLYKFTLFRKSNLLMNFLFFPIDIADEYIFHINNLLICRQYFKKQLHHTKI